MKNINLLWRSESRYYRVIFQKDLFGDWEMIRFWGALNNKSNGQKREVLQTYEDGLLQLDVIKRSRSLKGYLLSH